ncbi:MAG: restriction endonuclease subunit S [Oscillospiraceae bacterium]|nr:restriction endonuclease subunit S [Oscillospiraceae bacterium]
MSMPWYGALPKRWEAHKTSELFSERCEKVSDTDFAPLSVSKGGIVPQIATVAKSNAGDNRKLVRKGDFAINSRSDRRGSSGVSQYDGSVSLINIVLKPRSETNGNYWHYLLKSHSFIEEYYRNGRGIVADLWTTRLSEMKTIYLPLPPRDEQDQIVRYLDWKVSQINKLINTKRRQIALLGEQKRALVNEAVTQGGEGWEDISLGNLGSFRKGFGGSRADDSADGVACIRYGDIYRTGALLLKQPITRINQQSAEGYARVNKNEMLFALSGETKEEIGQSLINNIDEDTWCSGDAAIFTANTRILPQFLVFALRCPDVVRQRASLAKGDIIVHISTSALRRLRISAPPIAEQQEIATYLSNQCERIDKVIEDLNQEITLFTEYRTRLISDVVTGKLNVRSVIVPEYEAVEDVAEETVGEDEEVVGVDDE